MIACYLLVHDAWTFTIALVLHGVVTGSFYTASASLGMRLLPRAKFAEIGSAGGVINSVVGIFVAPTIGLMLDHAHSDYHSTFLDGFAIGVVALLCFTVLNFKFNALGGLRNYRAPGSDSVDDQLNQVSSAR
jgi:MFS family permease